MSPTLEQQIRTFIIDNFLFGGDASGLGNQDSLLDKSIVDSTGVLELVAFLQSRFGIEVNDDELVPDNFDSIGKLAAFVDRRQGNAGSLQ